MLTRINFLITLILLIVIYLIWMSLVLFFGLIFLIKTFFMERPWRGGANNHADDPSLHLSSSTPPTPMGAASFLETHQDDC